MTLFECRRRRVPDGNEQESYETEIKWYDDEGIWYYDDSDWFEDEEELCSWNIDDPEMPEWIRGNIQ